MAEEDPKAQVKEEEAPETKDWSVQAESTDGVTVVLGKYFTEAEAKADLRRIIDDGYYENVRVVAPGKKRKAAKK